MNFKGNENEREKDKHNAHLVITHRDICVKMHLALDAADLVLPRIPHKHTENRPKDLQND